MIKNVQTQRIEYKGQRILTEMFSIFESDPERLLPNNTALAVGKCDRKRQKKSYL